MFINNIKYQPNIGNLLYFKYLIYSSIRVIHKVLNIQGFALVFGWNRGWEVQSTSEAQHIK
jgi:hypothetical protein